MLHYCVLHAFLRAAWITGWQSYMDDCVLHYCITAEGQRRGKVKDTLQDPPACNSGMGEVTQVGVRAVVMGARLGQGGERRNVCAC